MADFIVALLSTSVILLLSYLFWKWHTQRNNLTNEGKNRPALSRADMLKNRLKRFEARGFDDDRSSVQKGPKNQSIINGSEDVGDIGENQELQTQEDSVDTELNTINLPGILNADNSGSRIEGVQGQSSGYKPAAKNKPSNSRKWVTLSNSNFNDISAPVTRPLTNLDELLAWTEGFDELNVSSVSLGRVGNSLERRPRTIVCHDMKGGYVQDRFVQGCPSTECYRIYHWQYIDIFIYFSHNFLTIPPPCWTNAAHKHGVLVLGTFITEWEDGAARCAEIFKDQLSYRQVADQLVFIAKYYGFDGWLINIENPIQGDNKMASETLNRGTRRVLSKLEKSIEDGDHYEAHQMIRTLYFRYMNQTKHSDALVLVYDGATMLLQHDQEESGLDLCQLMLKCFEESYYPVNDDALDKISAHFQLFKPCSPNRRLFIDAALSWTAKKNTEWVFGHPKLNLLCAETYWKEHNYGEAQSHFLHANNGQQCATMLVEYAVTCGYPGEADLFVAQAVLQFLCLKRSLAAHCVFVQYTDHHPDFSGQGPPFEKPLLNFLWILLIIIDKKGTINQFTVLCEKYHPSLNRDPNYLSYLDKIGQLFFGLTPKPKEPSMNNFFGDLLQSLTSEAEQPTTSSVDLNTEDLD